MTFNKKRVCSVFCNNEYDFPYPPDNPFLCSDNGKWSHKQTNLPECVKADPLDIFSYVETTFEYSGDCENLTTDEELEITRLAEEALKDRLCRGECKEFVISNVVFECGEQNEDEGNEIFRREIRTENSIAFVKFRVKASDSGSILNVTNCNASCRTASRKLVLSLFAKKLVQKLVDEPMTIEIKGKLLRSKDAIASKVQAMCIKPRQTKIGSRCFSCGKGSYFHEGKCMPCPLHTYQDRQRKSRCKRCPDGYGTLWKGSKSLAQCLKRCRRGTFSQNGVEPCSPCPMHTYQPDEGQTSCITCPDGKITKQVGQSLCVPNCTNTCLHGHLCDKCRCLSDYRVCDLTMDCVDGSDERDCESCRGFFCPADFLIYQHICIASFAAVAEVKKVVKIDDTRSMLKCDVKEVLYSSNDTDVSSIYDGHYYLGSKAAACNCPHIPSQAAGSQFVVTGHRNRDGEMIVSHDGIFKPWRDDTKVEIVAAVTRVKNGNCSLIYGWDEE